MGVHLWRFGAGLCRLPPPPLKRKGGATVERKLKFPIVYKERFLVETFLFDFRPATEAPLNSLLAFASQNARRLAHSLTLGVFGLRPKLPPKAFAFGKTFVLADIWFVRGVCASALSPHSQTQISVRTSRFGCSNTYRIRTPFAFILPTLYLFEPPK